MMRKDGCSMRRRATLVLATIWLNDCATAGSDERALESVRASNTVGSFQGRAAEKLALLPEESVVPEMLADYTVVRKQLHAC